MTAFVSKEDADEVNRSAVKVAFDFLDTPVENLTRNQARFALAVVAVARLSSLKEKQDKEKDRDYFSTRATLFSPFTKVNSASITKEGLGRSWQSEFLNRLVDQGMLEKTYDGRSVMYRLVVSDEEVNKLLADGGKGVKKVLWPNQFVDEDEDDEVEEDEDTDDEPSEDEESVSNELGIVKEVAAQLGVLAGSLKDIAGTFKSHDDQLKEHGDKLDSIEKSVALIATAVDKTLTRIEKVVEQLVDERRVKLAEITTQLTEANARERSALNQLESAGRQKDSVLRNLESLLQGMKADDRGAR